MKRKSLLIVSVLPLLALVGCNNSTENSSDTSHDSSHSSSISHLNDTTESAVIQESSSTTSQPDSASVSIDLEEHFLINDGSIKLSTSNQLLYSTSDPYEETKSFLEKQLSELDVEDTRVIENEDQESLVVTTIFESNNLKIVVSKNSEGHREVLVTITE